MNLLLSAYACEPGKGSEPAVGWNWALALMRRGHQVHVLTRSNNRAVIESAEAARSPALTFHYYDLPLWCRLWKHWPGGLYLYYLLWQIGASRRADRLHARIRFDLVHHVTFASFRQPSFMGALGIPFLFGPAGGGEAAPPTLLWSLPLMARLREFVRSLANHLVCVDPLMRMTFSKAQAIFCTTTETLARIPRRFHPKCRVELAIRVNTEEIAEYPETSPAPPNFLFIGRLLAWKGVHLALHALARVRAEIPNATLRVIGTGHDESWFKAQACVAGVSDAVTWVRSIPYADVAREYRQSTALVFPSLHDSGGMVPLEALAAGLPVLCLDCGGPAAIVTADSGIAIPSLHGDQARIVDDLAQAMIHLATNRDLHQHLSAGAIARAHQLTWDRMAETIYAPYEQSNPTP
jgi:glycosyltransferase involved in cell wall biosynthesis